jgi:hypothetical protein
MGSIQATIVNGTFDFNLVLALVLPGEGNTPTAAEDTSVPISPGGEHHWSDEFSFGGGSVPFLRYRIETADGEEVGTVEVGWDMQTHPTLPQNSYDMTVYDGSDWYPTPPSAKDVKKDYVSNAKVAFIVGGEPGAWTATVSPSSQPATGETTGGGLIGLQYRFMGSFLPGNDPHAVIAEQSGPDFEQTHAEFVGSGLAITQFCTFGSGVGRVWGGVYRGIGFQTALVANLTIDDFKAEFESRFGQDCLIGVETYVENGERLWAGVWQLGRTDGHIFFWDWDIAGFRDATQEAFNEGFPLSVAKHYQDGDQHLWAGIAHAKTVGSHVELDMDPARFLQVWTEKYPTMILVYVDSYRTQESGFDPGTTRFAGIWHTSPEANGLSWGVDADGLVSEFYYWHDQGLRLAAMTPYLWDGTF